MNLGFLALSAWRNRDIRRRKEVVKLKILCLLAALLAFTPPIVRAVVDDAHSFALEIATPYVEKGFSVREEHWSGSLAKGQPSAIQHQLYKGNEYWFWLASDEEGAEVTIHVYDDQKNLVDAEAWQKGKNAAVRVKPTRTGSYYIVFSVTKSKLKKTSWAIAYGFK
jgi:hypothetical protein